MAEIHQNHQYLNCYIFLYRIGHDNAGGGGAWLLDRVEVDCPSLGKKWLFPCGRWLAKDEDDGQLERKLYPQEAATEDYAPCKYKILISINLFLILFFPYLSQELKYLL